MDCNFCLKSKYKKGFKKKQKKMLYKCAIIVCLTVDTYDYIHFKIMSKIAIFIFCIYISSGSGLNAEVRTLVEDVGELLQPTALGSSPLQTENDDISLGQLTHKRPF